MVYGQRDKFIQTLVTFTTSDQAKAMTQPELQDLLLKIRDRYSPDISNEDWAEIAQGVNDFKFVITDTVKYGEVPNIEDQLPKQIIEQEFVEEKLELPENETTEEYEKVMEQESNNTIDEMDKEDEKKNGVIGESGVWSAKEDDISSEDIKNNPEVYDEPEEDGVTEEDDYDEPEPEPKPEEPEPKKFGRFVKPKETKPIKVNTSRLKGLLKPKKTDD